ncbi:YbhB/YbcL family Raf kinase inhibitor-like protein [Pseudomonas sp. RIT-To-2]|uniref:YbhB/YbcL family Raf kinase inhibitor-like protein n=1 Tax=Pseudomonas sp. RIT-To-2 TaxID=3462541 RepID=UPI002413B869
MKLVSQSFADQAVIPGEFAFAVIDPAQHIALSTNRNPHFAWSDAPAGTQSFALICHDPDVPSRGDDVNQEGKTVSKDLPRVDFFHWILLDLPATQHEIQAGAFSAGITARGKSGEPVQGLRQGINNYTDWFASDPDMSGTYFGYDGPCPPWNDEIAHRYIFTLYALDVAALKVEGDLTGPNVLKALEGHVLAKTSYTGSYTLNPAV